MAYTGTNPTFNWQNLTPQSTDPVSPNEGDLFISDGTPRPEGLWIYQNGMWNFASGTNPRIYDIIVGSATDVSNGFANYSSIQSAVNAAASGDKILILDNTYVENVSISSKTNITLEGKGYDSYIQGALTISSSTGILVQGVRIGTGASGLSFSGGSENRVINSWVISTGAINDSGTNNVYLVQDF